MHDLSINYSLTAALSHKNRISILAYLSQSIQINIKIYDNLS